MISLLLFVEIVIIILMMDNSLTVLFLTVNRTPKKWAEYHKSVLLNAIGDTPIITISRKPLDWGINLIQKEKPSVLNIYKQLLRGARAAKTPYIAVAEDDCLYPRDHFEYRPKKDVFAYNHHRWGLLTWGEPVFYHRPRISNSTLIASRELVVKALEERFRLYPDFGSIRELGRERGTRLSYRNKLDYFYTTGSVVFLSHIYSLDATEREQRKKIGKIRAYEILIWGRAEDIVKKFYEK